MKKLSQEEVTDKLHQDHFPRGPELERLSDPVIDTPMLVTLEQLRPYEHNPRFIRNPLFDDIKASIRERGLDQPPPITRRPGETYFIIRNGGNTRLAILGELWQETHDERFFRIHCLFRPWSNEITALLGHLAESDLHGQLTFIERALAVAKLKPCSNQMEQRSRNANWHAVLPLEATHFTVAHQPDARRPRIPTARHPTNPVCRIG